MINFLEGKIELKTEKYIVLNVAGVGYKVFVGTETQQKIPEKSGEVKIWTHLQVREDAMDLYGFLHLGELDFFEMLISVSGVGPRTALGVLSVGSADNLKRAIAAGDHSYLIRVSGIGRKTAERIIVELKDKLAGRGMTVDAPELREEIDALEALMALGYSQSEARQALQQPPGDLSAEKRIKEALRKLGKKS